MKSLISTAGRLALSLFALRSDSSVASTHHHVDDDGSCRSNATHIVWKNTNSNGPQKMATMPAFGRRRGQVTVPITTATTTTMCSVQLRSDAEQECLKYLAKNLMAFDEPFRETLGFSTSDDDENTADGLDNGMVGPTVTLALNTKINFEWTDDLPKHIFMEYVLNFANLNEARTNWRPLITDVLNYTNVIREDYEKKLGVTANLTSTVTWVNTHLWTKLARDPNHPIYFKSSQTPLIFDPMSIIAYGYASCTGTSILFSNALRAVGVASRVAGTPAWYGNRTQGNHNWVEVYVPANNKDTEQQNSGGGADGEWKFLEPSPALPHVDTLDKDPCTRWFCDPSRYPSSRVYAAGYSKHSHHSCEDEEAENHSANSIISPEGRTTSCGTHFPLAWEWDCQDVPGIDRTQYYTDVCGLCGGEEE